MPTEIVPARILRQLADDVDSDFISEVKIEFVSEGPIYREGTFGGTHVMPEHMVAKLEVHYKPVTTE